MVRRTQEPFALLTEIRQSFAQLETAMNTYSRKHFVLLVDMRSAPQRNDPEFEREASYQQAALCKDFLRVAVLIKTASGRLQLTRHIRREQLPMEVFSDEAEARKYLLERPS